MENQITSKQDLAIKEIIVEKLFGYFDYRLTNTNTESIENQLLILYGDNGSGKTTILKLIFYLLSSKDKSGHKSKIAQTKFKKFSVILNCGIEIGALRTDGDLGSFNYYIKKKTKILFEVYLKASQDLSIKLDEDAPENVKFKLMLSYLRSLNLLIFYLSDERKALDSLTSVELDEDQISSDVEYYIANEREIQRRRKGIESQINIDIIIKRLNDWIQQQIIIGSSIGQINMNSIYLDLIYELLKAKKVKTQSIDKEPVLRSFDVIDEKIKEYSMFGLVNELDFSKIKAILSTTTEEQLFSAFPIIESFISTLNARLDALKKIHEIILSLINSVNTYFSNKRLSYNIKTGFIVKYITGEDINFNVLSSGEKQLLILLCNVIIASERATIFIIDEPELSLNIKWQRQLLQTLLTLNKEGHVQFLIATHSIELLTTFNNYTIKLESKR